MAEEKKHVYGALSSLFASACTAGHVVGVAVPGMKHAGTENLHPIGESTS